MSCVGFDLPWDNEPFWNILAQPCKSEEWPPQQEENRLIFSAKPQLHSMDAVSGFSSESDTIAEDNDLFPLEVDSLFDYRLTVEEQPALSADSIELIIDPLPPVYTDIPQSSANASNAVFSQPWSSSEENHVTQVQSLPFKDLSLNINSKDELEISDDDCEDNELDHSLKNGQISNGILPAVETVFSRNPPNAISIHTTQPPPSHSSDRESTANARSYLKQTKGQPILYLVIFHALEHPEHYFDMIKWVDRTQGIFEFSSENKDSFARAWGKVKSNRCLMTYQKMSRALRIYVKKKIVLKKIKKKLQYIFLPETMEELLKKSTGSIVSSKIADIMYKESRIAE